MGVGKHSMYYIYEYLENMTLVHMQLNIAT